MERGRALPGAARHGAGFALVGGFAALPVMGLPMAPEGQPFLLVLAILFAALFLGQGSAISASLVAGLAGVFLLLPESGRWDEDTVRAVIGVGAFIVVGVGLAAAADTLRRILALMDVADARRSAPPVPVPAPGRAGLPADPRLRALRLLAMSPAERLAAKARDGM